MPLPAAIVAALAPFRSCFRRQTWAKAQLLLLGAILAPRARTVAAALRVVGLAHDPTFARYHQVLSRGAWSSRKLAQRLLLLLLQHLDRGDAPLVFGLDETLERRWGPRIGARGIYRDPVRSSQSHFVKASGLRWVCLMWLAPIPWAHRVWALPILTVLAPSERWAHAHGTPHKPLTHWARQMLAQLRRWLPHRSLILLADRTYAALDFLHACRSMSPPVTVITRLRLDARLFAPAPARRPRQRGRPPRTGPRLPTLRQRMDLPSTPWERATIPWYDGTQRELELASDTAIWAHPGLPLIPLRWVLVRDPAGELEPQALLCTDPELAPQQIVAWFVQRWRLEVTFQEARKHLGVETQRQWSEPAIARTTPALLGLFSWVTLAAHLLQPPGGIPVQSAAWYHKALPTFADALALVRHHLWPSVSHFLISRADPDPVEIPRPFLEHLVAALAYAA